MTVATAAARNSFFITPPSNTQRPKCSLHWRPPKLIMTGRRLNCRRQSGAITASASDRFMIFAGEIVIVAWMPQFGPLLGDRRAWAKRDVSGRLNLRELTLVAKNGRASGRERWCQYVYISVVAVP